MLETPCSLHHCQTRFAPLAPLCSLPSCSLAKPSFEDTWAYQAISCLLARRPSHLKELPSGRTHPPGSHAVQLLGRAPPSTALGPARSLEGLKAISHLFQLWGRAPH